MLRGICFNEWIDIFYTLIFDDETNMPYYVGDTGTRLFYDEESLHWTMSQDGLNGSAPASISSLGTGGIRWSFSRDICNRKFLYEH